MPRESKKNRILETAKQLFAEKGYNATGMEEIATKAEIPKSLIYYHFKNKEALLTTIMNDFMNEYNQILHNQTQGIEKISIYIEFLKQNRYCAKIMISESLKTGGNQNMFFYTLIPLMGMDKEQLSNENINHAHWLTEFFTSIVPSVLFVCYEDSWCDYFGVTPEQMEKDYINAYRLTHGAYHNHINKESH